jgi:GNAT superfamily N-acetyltransferase
MNNVTGQPHTNARHGYPQVSGDHWIPALRDGRHVLVRPLVAQDRQREYAFIKHLSPESRHMRFLSQVKEPDATLMDKLMDTDGKQRVAFIALAHENGELIEVGISRYAAVDSAECECAVTVADEWANNGLGTFLMERLIDAARHNGFQTLYSVDASNNTPMRNLAAALGFGRHLDPDDLRQVIYRLKL